MEVKLTFKIRALLLTLFSGLSVSLFSQDFNYVKNPSFEEYIKCPFENDNENFVGSLSFWFLPTLGTSDYFNECSDFEHLQVPSNFFGYQEPRTGKGYAGLYASNIFRYNKNYREYLSVALVKELEEGQEYIYTMYVSLAENSVAASNNLGVYFHTDSLHGRIMKGNTIELPQEVSNIRVLGNVNYSNVFEDETIIVDTASWTKIEFRFIAKGNEKYLTIGNFRTDKQTKCKKIENGNRAREISPFYYIDDVSLIAVKFPYCE